LEHGAGGVTGKLDWAIKLSLFREFARRRGIDWQSLTAWNYVLKSLNAALQSKGEGEGVPVFGAEVLAANSPVADEVARLTPGLKAKGLKWDSLEIILALRRDLFELDTRFGQLGSEGLFSALDRAGALNHGVQGVENIENAIIDPPAVGRAHVRGKCVRQLSKRGDKCSCDWTGVWDDQNNRWLDLSEPFTSEENWQANPRSVAIRSNPLRDAMRESLDQVRQSYYRGCYERVYRILENIRRYQNAMDEDHRLEISRMRAWVQSRRGFLDGIDILNELGQSSQGQLWLILDYLCVYRFGGLAPRPEMAAWIQKGQDYLQGHPNETRDRIMVFQEFQGFHMMTEGRLEEARALLEDACSASRHTSGDARINCRTSALLAEVYRRLGKTRQASELAERIAIEQGLNQFEGDKAEFSMSCLAKLQTDRNNSLAILREALDIQTRLNHKMGQARTLLLQARFASDTACSQTIKQSILDLRVNLPALTRCPLLAEILDRWKEWVSCDRSPDESGDVFWGV
jgi:hypothetical protein